MARAIKISSVSGALTVAITGPNGGTPVVYADSSFSATQSMPATIADTATTTFWLQGPGRYTLSVKTSGGTEIAADNNSTRTVDLETDGTVAALNYDARTLATVSGDSGHSTAGSAASATTWQPNTPYTTSQTVIAPYGSIVSAKTTFTSGSTFSYANWDFAGPIDVRDFGVLADNSTDNTTALQAALTAAPHPVVGLTGDDAPSRQLILPAGRIKTGALTVSPNTVIRGQGRANTYLTTVGSLTTGALFTLANAGDAVQIEMWDFGIILNSTAIDGISFVQAGSASITGDTQHVFENLAIFGGKRAMFLTNGTENRIRNIIAYRQNPTVGQGAMEIGGTDWMMESCTVAQVQSPLNTLCSAYRLGTSNSRVVNCKAFGSANAGYNNAFYVIGQRNQLIGCEVQDYSGNGFGDDQGHNTFIGCIVDSCIAGFSTGGPTMVRGMKFLNRGGAYTITNALSIADNVGADIDCQLDGVTQLTAGVNQTGAGNRIRINGEGSAKNVAYAATITPDPTAATVHIVGALTANITVANPSSTITYGIRPGQRVAFVFTQDATGGRTVTWGTNYSVNNPPNTAANSVSRIEFEYDGVKWREVVPPSSSSATLVTTKGDTLAATAPGTLARVGVGADGTVLTADSTQTAGVRFASVSGAGGISGGPAAIMASGNWTQIFPGNNTTGTIGANQQLLAYPFVLATSATISGFAIFVNTVGATGSTLGLAVYNSANGLPSTILYDAGTVTGDATGQKTITPGSPPSLTAGTLYYLAYLPVTTAAVPSVQKSFSAINNCPPSFIVPSGTTPQNVAMGAPVIHSAAVSTMPGTFISTYGASIRDIPAVCLKAQ